VESDVGRWRATRADIVVADPSREGLGRRGVDALVATGATRLVLVSCDAVSLARDAALLAAHGFRHGGSTVVDLFPHTPHVEVVTTFDRA
jgi:tRNA/tmRNA/rRNA uracil-C5-methylase (TrmA/RlmC/RlmD family)